MSEPRYESIARTLSTLIERGVLRPGDRVPSLRDTREQSGASLGTIMQAYARLEDVGLIEARSRSGYYVRARPSPPAEEPAMSSPPKVSTEVNVASLVFDVLEAIKQPEIVPLGSAFPSPEHFVSASLAFLKSRPWTVRPNYRESTSLHASRMVRLAVVAATGAGALSIPKTQGQPLCTRGRLLSRGR